MDIRKLLDDYNVPYVTEGHKHCQEGWLQVECPFCTGNRGYHLGYNIRQEWWNCWRCGWKPDVQVISTLTGLSYGQAKDALSRYGKHRSPSYKEEIKNRKPLTVPGSSMTYHHYAYLKSRKFKVTEIKKTWNLLGTGIIGDYSHRIIAPIYYNKQIVSFQGRDITGKSDLKYKACKKENEIVHHKHILYGLQHATKRTCVVVEGITDVWRLGKGAVATFGIKYTPHQVNLLSLLYDTVIIMFDPEPQAQKQAHILASMLDSLDVMTKIAKIDAKDPAELDPVEAEEFMMLNGMGVNQK